jgi:hypothetical protein
MRQSINQTCLLWIGDSVGQLTEPFNDFFSTVRENPHENSQIDGPRFPAGAAPSGSYKTSNPNSKKTVVLPRPNASSSSGAIHVRLSTRATANGGPAHDAVRHTCRRPTGQECRAMV